MPIRRYFKINSGQVSYDLGRVINGVTKFRIAQLDYTHSAVTSNLEMVHLKINDYQNNYDETNQRWYTLAFPCYPSDSMAYAPSSRYEDVWFQITDIEDGISSIKFETRVDGNVIADMSAQNYMVELEFA
jgi:hypothetical protein